MPRVLGGVLGGWVFSYGRGTPVGFSGSALDQVPQHCCREDIAHTRQSTPYSGLGFQAKVLRTLSVVSSLLKI